jgi:integrase/recombinase XerD
MSRLRCALADYLAVRRALGYKLKYAEKLLTQFIAYLEEFGEETISTERSLAWATLPKGAEQGSWAYYRLSAVRCFATHLKSIDPATEIPATGLLPRPRPQTVPYIYSEEQITALLEATGTLSTPHRAATYRTLVGLLAATGMRVGEAIRLDRDDLNSKAELIVVRDTKFGKSRELALRTSTAAALRRYLRRTDRPASETSTDALLVSTTGARLHYQTVHWTFTQLLDRTGIQSRSIRSRPRLHDLRHTFAVHTILDGYRGDGEIEGRLAALSTYLGHVGPSSTYWYLSAAPELMELAAERLESYLGDRS